jgi:hypothetical protein
MHIDLLGGGKVPIEDLMRMVVAVSAVVAAYLTIFLGQMATKDAGFSGRLAFLQMAHRSGFWCFALALFYHAKQVVGGEGVPDFSDLLVYSTMMIVCVLAALQRYLMPPAPQEDRPLRFTLTRRS